MVIGLVVGDGFLYGITARQFGIDDLVDGTNCMEGNL